MPRVAYHLYSTCIYRFTKSWLFHYVYVVHCGVGGHCENRGGDYIVQGALIVNVTQPLWEPCLERRIREVDLMCFHAHL